MSQYSWNISHERECARGVFVDILTKHGISYRELVKGRNHASLRPSLELLIEDGKIRGEIVPGFDDLQDAERFFPVHSVLF